MKNILILSMSVLVLAGCASKQSQPQPKPKCECGPYLWEHAIIHPDDTNKLWVIRIQYREEPLPKAPLPE